MQKNLLGQGRRPCTGVIGDGKSPYKLSNLNFVYILLHNVIYKCYNTFEVKI